MLRPAGPRIILLGLFLFFFRAIHFPYFERLAKTAKSASLTPAQERLVAELIGPALFSSKARCTDEQLAHCKKRKSKKNLVRRVAVTRSALIIGIF